MQRRNEECKQVFVDEWTDETPDLPYPEHIKDFRPCGEGSTLYDEATTHCGILNDPTGTNITYIALLLLLYELHMFYVQLIILRSVVELHIMYHFVQSIHLILDWLTPQHQQ